HHLSTFLRASVFSQVDSERKASLRLRRLGEFKSSPSESRALLRAVGLGKSFGSIPVLHDASLELRAGEVHVLAGENGAGKTTLIRIFAGLLAADHGRLEV